MEKHIWENKFSINEEKIVIYNANFKIFSFCFSISLSFEWEISFEKHFGVNTCQTIFEISGSNDWEENE